MKTALLLFAAALICLQCTPSKKLSDEEKKELQKLVFTLTDIELPEKSRIIAGKKLLALGDNAAPVIPDLITALRDNQGHYEYPEKILASIGEKAVPHLIRVIEDDHPRHWKVRRRAAYILSLMGKKAGDAIPVLLVSIKDENRGVREDSAYALGYIGNRDNRVIQSLMKAVNDNKPGVRRAAVRSLYRAAKPQFSKEVINSITSALKDKHWTVRKAAARALGRMGPLALQALPELQKLLNDEKESVRKAVQLAVELIDYTE